MVWRCLNRLAAGWVLLLALAALPAAARPRSTSPSSSRSTSPTRWIPRSRRCSARASPRPSARPLVHDAIRRGMLGRIAVVYMEWAGAYDQQVIVPWTVLDNPESILAFADKIASTPLRRAQRTSISGAIDFGVKLLRRSGSRRRAG